MRFFVPDARDDAEAERVYQAVVRFVADNVFPVSAERYYALDYYHNGRAMRAVVGRPDEQTGEIVIAILKAQHEGGPYMICTEQHGVARGHPLLADGGPNSRATRFEED
jgi:hypothetical protein